MGVLSRGGEDCYTNLESNHFVYYRMKLAGEFLLEYRAEFKKYLQNGNESALEELKKYQPIAIVNLCEHHKDLHDIIRDYFRGIKREDKHIMWIDGINFGDIESTWGYLEKLIEDDFPKMLESYPVDPSLKPYTHVVLYDMNVYEGEAEETEFIGCEEEL